MGDEMTDYLISQEDSEAIQAAGRAWRKTLTSPSEIRLCDAWYGFKGDNMEISADFQGKIRRIGNQYILQLGCKEFICQTLNDVGKKVTLVLAEAYEEKDENGVTPV